MSSPVFAFYLTCLFLETMAETTDLKFSSLVLQDSGFVTLQTGEKLRLQCFYKGEFSARLYWYKQPLGQRPRLISSYYKYQIDVSFYDEFKNNQRFTLDTEDNKNHLTISDLHTSDSATYYCVSFYAFKFEFAEGITVIVEDSGLNIPTLVHQSASETIQPGGSVTLSCTVRTGTCDGEHSVYWFKNSGESQPGLIYTHGGSNDQCERKPNTQTHTCVYNLAMKNLSLSHAGIYYCAVASCGHILFGNGTKLDFEHEVDFSELYFWRGISAFTTILAVLLAFSVCMMNKRNTCQYSESQARCSAPSAEFAKGHQKATNLYYPLLSVNLAKRSRSQRDQTWSECVYYSAKQ